VRSEQNLTHLHQVLKLKNSSPAVVRDRQLVRLYNAYLAKHGQQPMQRFRITSTESLLPPSKPQEPTPCLAIQVLDVDLFLLKPPTEIGYCADLLPDRTETIALFGNASRIGVEVLTQRPLAQSFNGAWEGEELVYHSSRVPSRPAKLCRIGVGQTPMNGDWNVNMRHSPGSGIVPPMPHAA